MADLQHVQWTKSMIQEDSIIMESESWVPQYYDTGRIYIGLPVNSSNQIDIQILKAGDYIVLNNYDSNGIRVRGILESEQVNSVRTGNMTTIEAMASHMRLTKLDSYEIKRVVSKLGNIYSNGDTNICIK